MMCVVSVRRIKPGTYDEFRRAWEPDPWPQAATRAWLSRNIEDPDEVCTIGLFDMSFDDFDAMRDDPTFVKQETARIARIAPYEEAVLINAIYEIAEDIELAPGERS